MVDVREVLDGNVWPQDVRSFGGDEVDILAEQLVLGDDSVRRAAAVALLELFGDRDPVIRTLAVKALPLVRANLTAGEIRTAIRRHHDALLIAPVEHRNVRFPTLLAAANPAVEPSQSS